MDQVELLDKEIQRLEKILACEKKPDIFDVAAVFALKDKKVRKLLDQELVDGAIYKGAVVQPLGTVACIAQFDIETEWTPGESRLTPPPVIAVVMELSPPRVIECKVEYRAGPPATSPFSRPEGRLPVALQNLTAPSPGEATSFNEGMREQLIDFINNNRLEKLLELIGAGGAMQSTAYGFTSGTQCSSFLCFERTSDDQDDPSGSMFLTGRQPYRE
ncbi:MAG: hypothetical protein EP334_06605 [Gammaproteobacteria bacterium]|nr:MAG: hypothetical protein EP334_06605 [Gammaproteobacteria bacterium]